ncbi:hypothetical protein OIO90_005874 [Microbotryomycetes sp. JL221]|nr:hypothetical protein OIO90_005874 [Microbotryomycetes sp. JL221]
MEYTRAPIEDEGGSRKRQRTNEGSSSPTDDDHVTTITDVTDKEAPRSCTLADSDSQDVIVCHQDAQAYTSKDAHMFLTCTNKRASDSTSSSKARCGNSFCARCLWQKYKVDIDTFKTSTESEREWICPQCTGTCSCASCRQKINTLRRSGPSALKHVPSPFSVEIASSQASSSRNQPIDLTADSDSSLSALSDSDDENKTEATQTKPPTATKKLSKVSKKANGEAVAAVLSKTSKANIESTSMSRSSSKTGSATAHAGGRSAEGRKRQNVVPPHVDAPPCYPFSRYYSTPSTINLKARLHIRCFVLRFLNLMSSLDPRANGSSKTKQILNGLSDDPIWFFSQNAAIGHIRVLKGLLELLEGEEQADIMDSRHSWSLMELLIQDQVDNAISTTKKDVVNQPWETLKEILETEEIWTEDWKSLIQNWEMERENGIIMDRETRGRTGETSADEKLGLLCGLIELIYGAESVRQEISEGIDRERDQLVRIGKVKATIRKDWDKARKDILSESGPKPKSHKQQVEWRKKFPNVEQDLQQAEDDGDHRMLECQHDVFLTHSENILRFGSCGMDVDGREYYILNLDRDHSRFPGTKNLREHDDYPLSWTILVHGRPFDFDKPKDQQSAATNLKLVNKTAESKLASKKPESKVNDKDEMEVDDEDESQQDREARIANPQVAEEYKQRAKAKDAWFLVDANEDGDDLADWIEYRSKLLDYRDWKKEQEQVQKAVPMATIAPEGTQTAPASGRGRKPKQLTLSSEDTQKPWRDVSELVASVRAFVDFVQFESDAAEQVVDKRKRKSRWV